MQQGHKNFRQKPLHPSLSPPVQWATWWNFHYLIFTVRKWSLGQGNVLHLYVILFTGGLASQHAWQVTWPGGSASRGSASRGVPPPGGLHPGGLYAGGSASTGCLYRGCLHLWGLGRPPSPRHGQQAGGKHPTGIHSFWQNCCRKLMEMEEIGPLQFSGPLGPTTGKGRVFLFVLLLMLSLLDCLSSTEVSKLCKKSPLEFKRKRKRNPLWFPGLASGGMRQHTIFAKFCKKTAWNWEHFGPGGVHRGRPLPQNPPMGGIDVVLSE